MKEWQFRLIAYPVVSTIVFMILVILGAFISSEIDPMKWTTESRGWLVAVWSLTQIAQAMVIEFNELPRKITKNFREQWDE